MAPHLPTNMRGKARVDDRRVISGIIHVLKSGGRWVDAPEVYGPCKTLYNRFVRWAVKGIWTALFQALPQAGGPPAHVLMDSSAVKAHRSAAGGKGGSKSQAIARSRGGRSTKIHALTNRHCCPIGFILTGGQVADCKAAAALLHHLPPSARVLHGDKGYDTNAIRQQLEATGTLPNIPPKANRIWKRGFSPVLYRARNAIERMFCRLKDFRRVATRYDRLAADYLAAVCRATPSATGYESKP
ncbi:IS5 family transposase [Salinarimonas soli]|uniref:IS5 family transposase n=1 Tax=Salinarimonas soli TaxID=1638099 RepID=A0A5B2VEW1_9HYPH|nr:IS5 family transposase [Salinarimonas soli]